MTSSANSEHKEWVAATFDRAALKYGEKSAAFFDYFGQKLVDFAAVMPTDQILDVATGKGAILHPLSKIAKSITGIDISQNMLQLARVRVGPEVPLLQMDAENLTFPNRSFDVVFCAFALFFFPDLQKALSEFRRVLKPGGKLVVSVWANRGSLGRWLVERATELGAVRTLRQKDLSTEKHLEDQIPGIEVEEVVKTFWHSTKEEWWESLWSHGTRSKLEQLDSKSLERLKQEAFERCGLGPIADECRVLMGLLKC